MRDVFRHGNSRLPGEGADFDDLLHPARAFARPSDVVDDPDLTLNEKRAILASWASDSCAAEATQCCAKAATAAPRAGTTSWTRSRNSTFGQSIPPRSASTRGVLAVETRSARRIELRTAGRDRRKSSHDDGGENPMRRRMLRSWKALQSPHSANDNHPDGPPPAAAVHSNSQVQDERTDMQRYDFVVLKGDETIAAKKSISLPDSKAAGARDRTGQEDRRAGEPHLRHQPRRRG